MILISKCCIHPQVFIGDHIINIESINTSVLRFMHIFCTFETSKYAYLTRKFAIFHMWSWWIMMNHHNRGQVLYCGYYDPYINKSYCVDENIPTNENSENLEYFHILTKNWQQKWSTFHVFLKFWLLFFQRLNFP